MENATPYQECSGLLGDGASLRVAARERGYLFFRGRLPAAAVREVRRDVLREIQRQGYLAPDAPLEDGMARSGTRSLRSTSIPSTAPWRALRPRVTG